MRKQCRIERRADSVEVLGGPVEIDRVPVGNRRNQQVQPRCAKFLIFQRAIGEPTLPLPFWLAPLVGMLLWPAVFWLLDTLRMGGWRRS